ncbi:hypothetical protein [Thermophilibacter sp.]
MLENMTRAAAYGDALVRTASRSRGQLVQVHDPQVGLQLGDVLPYVVMAIVVIVAIVVVVRSRRKK